MSGAGIPRLLVPTIVEFGSAASNWRSIPTARDPQYVGDAVVGCAVVGCAVVGDIANVGDPDAAGADVQ